MGKLKELCFPELSFDEKTHTYKLKGFTIPSVTTIMAPLADSYYKNVQESVLYSAGNRGTAVHNSIENYVKYGIEDIAPEYVGYFNAFLDWYKSHQVKPYGSEVRLYHKSLLYAGTADMFADVNGKASLIDFKTTYSVSEMMCGVQLEAYQQAIISHMVENPFAQKMIIHLKKDGKYEEILFPNRDMWRWKVFNALFTVYCYKQDYSE